ncbi:MAG: hypothetical protein ABI564_04360 [Ideonella sp.]
MVDVTQIADQLLTARQKAALMPLPSSQGPFTLADAFAVGDAIRGRRMAAGELPRGYKIGFTNRSIWARYGVYAPIWAPVWDSTVRVLDVARAELSMAGLVQPRFEPEVVFGFKRAPQPGLSANELIDCLDWVAHGAEIVHTHFDGWNFTAADSVADFALHGALLVGPRCDPAAFGSDLSGQLAALSVELSCDGRVVDRGQGSNVLDSPLLALHLWLQAMTVHSPHWTVEAGDMVTTGTITDAWPIAAGQHWQTSLSDQRLSGLSVTVTD